jgi:malate synthase
VDAHHLLDVAATPGDVTEDGLRNDVSVGLQYLEAWLRGNGAVAINNLMEDAATAEISRSQVWQWIHNGVRLPDGTEITADLVGRIEDEELAKIREARGDEAWANSRFDDARKLFERVALADDFADFLTTAAYDSID